MSTGGCCHPTPTSRRSVHSSKVFVIHTDKHQNVVLAQRPQLESTISSLPPPLLESLLPLLSTLSSVYHKPPSSFLGHGRSSALQQAAIEEAAQNARENPIAAGQGVSAAPQSNAENLLDIDFDGAQPASLQAVPKGGLSGLEGLAGTPMRVESPAATMNHPVASPPPPQNGGMDDLMGVFGDGGGSSAAAAAPHANGGSMSDLIDGFGGLGIGGTGPTSSHVTPQQDQTPFGAGDDDLLG